ncbi:hypothetical protein DQ237_14025 [Blastococcus sp. TF02-8]|uniref:hypothetical protein n=1 Tax=Blastococcus sp. TF02-8 TaxID=2250574 RepID=UPI000DEA28B1|nr:hypothetical protein [Blastococcus sp. TF02-8]RBY95631.1 hypothetical protein DQ237_14025 [Blastococcus sp. TF02-8]
MPASSDRSLFVWLALAGCLAGLGAATVSALDESSASVAVSNEDGEWEITSLVCDEAISRVEVQQVDAPSGGGTGPVLWRVESDSSSTETSVRVGEAPRGFEVVVPLEEPLPRDRTLRVAVSAGEDESVVDCDWRTCRRALCGSTARRSLAPTSRPTTRADGCRKPKVSIDQPLAMWRGESGRPDETDRRRGTLRAR